MWKQDNVREENGWRMTYQYQEKKTGDSVLREGMALL